MLAVASCDDPFACANFFDKSSIQSRAEAFGIQKSPIKSKQKSTKPRFSALLRAPQALVVAQAMPNHPVEALKVPESTIVTNAIPSNTEVQVTPVIIQDGFCMQLDAAARCGNVAAIDRCIRGGADLNQRTALSQQTPLHASLQSNQGDAIVVLVTRGADIYAVCLPPPLPLSTP
jgi:hypothetical protein